MISETDKAYAAGVIDSDGCIRVVKEGRSDNRMRSSTYYPHVLVSQADGEAIQFLQSKWGGSIHKAVQSGGRELFIFRWSLSWRKAEDFLIDIEPYMLIKKRQAQLALQLRRSEVRHIQSRRTNGTTVPLSSDEVQRRETIFLKMKELKTKHNHPKLTLKGVA